MQHPRYPEHTFMLFTPEDIIQVEAVLASISHDLTIGETNSYLYLLNDQSDPALRDILEASEELPTNSERFAFLEEVLKRYKGKTKHLPTNIKRTAKNVLKTLTFRREGKDMMKQSELQDLIGEHSKVLKIVEDVLIVQDTQKEGKHSHRDSYDQERAKRVCDVFGQFLEINYDATGFSYWGRYSKYMGKQYRGSGTFGRDEVHCSHHQKEYTPEVMLAFLNHMRTLEKSNAPQDSFQLKRYETFEYWHEDVTSAQIESWKTITHPTLRAEMETTIQEIVTLQQTRNVQLQKYDALDLAKENFEQQLRDKGLIDENMMFVEPQGTLAEVRGAHEMWDQYSHIRNMPSTYDINSLNEHIREKTVYANKLEEYSDLVEDGYDGIIQVKEAGYQGSQTTKITDYHTFSEKDQKLLISGRHSYLDIIQYITKQTSQKKAS